jgi:ATP-dependent RNA helicase DHX57
VCQTCARINNKKFERAFFLKGRKVTIFTFLFSIMAPRRKNNASIAKTGSTSSKAEPLPDWVKNKSIAKPPPKHLQPQQQSKPQSVPNVTASNSTPIVNAPPRPPPLFPPGTKTPINLLNERIQKQYSSLGWLKPNLEARRLPQQNEDGERWTFVVTLIKTNKADQSNPFTVRFDARDPSGLEGSAVSLGSKEEAKHWGATYALFRVS